jgi:hypothetical protein
VVVAVVVHQLWGMLVQAAVAVVIAQELLL